MKSYSDQLPEFDKVQTALEEIVRKELNITLDQISRSMARTEDRILKEQSTRAIDSENAIMQQTDNIRRVRKGVAAAIVLGIINTIGVAGLVYLTLMPF